MKRAWRLLALAMLALSSTVLASRLAMAKQSTLIRVTSGEHPGFGRVVLDAPGLAYSVSQDGGHVVISFSEDPVLGELPPEPRNVLAIRKVQGGVELTIPSGASVHTSRFGDKVIVDVEDPVPNRPPDTLKPDRPATPSKWSGRRGGRTAETSPVVAPPVVPAPPERTAAGREPVTVSHVLPAVPPGVLPTPPKHEDAVPGPKTVKQNPVASGPPTPAPHSLNVVPPLPLLKVVPAPPLPDVVSARPLVNAVQALPTTDTGTLPEVVTIQEKSPDPAPAPLPPDQAPTKPDGPLTGPAEALQVWPVTGDAAPAGPVALVAFAARPPGGLAGAAIQIPFAQPVGAALFSRGPDTFVVFDERRPIDLGALRDDPVFGSAIVTIYPTSTVIHLTRPPGRSAMLSLAQHGWRLSIVAASPKPAALTPVVSNDIITFAAEAPGQVVAITDPQTGGTLMVGTQRVSGQGVLTERRTPEFMLPITGQGIVVKPLSDAIGLRVIQAGFLLSGPHTGLALSPPSPMPEATMAAAGLTRLFEFPSQMTANLAWRTKQQAVSAAVAPPQARGPKRRALAESELGLGFGAEAQTLLRVTMKDDPREASLPVTMGLAAIAALLAGRPAEAGDLDNPRLTGTDEIALWRAIRTAMSDEGSPAAAAVLATTAPLLFTYPDELRRQVMPLALETMVLGGQADTAAGLLAQREDDPRLAYARALLKQAQGDNEGALKLFDELANSRSSLDHARAGVRATEVRLATGQLDAKGAADALQARLYAWRGDRRDLALQLRIADLRQKAGDWRSVFAQLREANADFPAQSVEIDRRLKEAFATVPRDPALDKMPAADLITLLDENAELMADGSDGEPMRVLLADKLMALDLPKRADPLLTRLMRNAPFGPARAEFGATLATLRLHEDDGDGALLALSESNSADMGDAVRERRALITARVEAERGHVGGAVDALSGSQSREAVETRANILEQAKDWPAARDALLALAALAVPDTGMLDNAQLGIMLRLATAATRAGDDATLASLRDKLHTRIGTGPQADMFRLLTAAPVRGTADLGRARAELGLAHSITADMTPKKSAAKTP